MEKHTQLLKLSMSVNFLKHLFTYITQFLTSEKLKMLALEMKNKILDVKADPKRQSFAFYQRNRTT